MNGYAALATRHLPPPAPNWFGKTVPTPAPKRSPWIPVAIVGAAIATITILRRQNPPAPLRAGERADRHVERRSHWLAQHRADVTQAINTMRTSRPGVDK